MEFVRNDVVNLVKRGAVIVYKESPTIVNPLTVSRNKENLRLVLDRSRFVNRYV